MRTRVQTEISLMVAACVAMGYLLSWIPNIELISTAVFTCGALRGHARGSLVGLLAGLLFFGLNPNGMSPPPLYVAQVVGLCLMGWGGGWVFSLAARQRWRLLVVYCATAGFILTLVYDLMTNTAGFVTFRTGSYVAYLLGGLSFPFPLAREVQNTLSFALATPAVVRAFKPWRSD